MSVLIWDLETDGLLNEVTKLNSLVIGNDAGDLLLNCAPPSTYDRFETGIERLMEADAIIGHNIIGYDIPVLDKLHPGWRPKRPNGRWNGPLVLDTLVLARLLWPTEVIRDLDFKRAALGKFPKHLIGRYTLEAFGYRLMEYKGDYKGPWDTWSEEMQEYCVQDVTVTTKLWHKCKEKLERWGLDPLDRSPQPGKDAIQLEHDVAWVVARQERNGFCFDTKGAQALYGKLAARREQLAAELALEFPPDVIRTPFTPKASNSVHGYVKGVPTVKVKTIPFNPGSRQQVAARLQRLGWKPEEYTPDGTPKLDDDVLRSLPYPQAEKLAEYFTIEKRLGQIGEGREAWLRVERKGRIHGRVITNGAVTGRMTHQGPNVAQVPTIHAQYGKECRALFRASPGKKLVGCDADALEMRCLAHYLFRWDEGAYARAVDEGRKDDGTDAHTLNALALGLEPKLVYPDGKSGRDRSKTWFYAFIYGAGDWKLGYTLTGLKYPKQKVAKQGATDRASFLTKLPAMGKIVKWMKQRIEGKKDANGATVRKGKNWVDGIDGRRVSVRSSHSALNTLLQSAGALVMKRALVILDSKLQVEHGLAPGLDFEFVGNIHDEWQIEAKPEYAEIVGQCAAEAIRLAGEYYNFNCPLKGNYVIGDTWADTH